jgi:hypothetical protein
MTTAVLKPASLQSMLSKKCVRSESLPSASGEVDLVHLLLVMSCMRSWAYTVREERKRIRSVRETGKAAGLFVVGCKSCDGS